MYVHSHLTKWIIALHLILIVEGHLSPWLLESAKSILPHGLRVGHKWIGSLHPCCERIRTLHLLLLLHHHVGLELLLHGLLHLHHHHVLLFNLVAHRVWHELGLLRLLRRLLLTWDLHCSSVSAKWIHAASLLVLILLLVLWGRRNIVKLEDVNIFRCLRITLPGSTTR